MEFLTLAFLLGVWSEENYLYSTVSAVCALCVSVLFVAVGKVMKTETNRRLLGGAGLCVLFFLCGIVRGQFVEVKSGESVLFEQEQVPFVAMVEGKDADEKSVLYTLRLADAQKVNMRTSITDDFALGDAVLVSPPWKEEDGVMSSDQKTLIKSSLSSHGKMVIAFPRVKKTEDTEEILAGRESFSLWFVSLREKVARELSRLVPGREGDLANGTLFGSEYLTKNEQTLFREAGISHIVALSGFNIAIVIAFLLVVLRYVPYMVRAALLTLSVGFYLMLVDVTGSLLRATLMASLSGALLFFGYKGDEKRILLLSLLLLAIVSPETVLSDVSLHLSYLALGGVMYVYPLFFKNTVDRYVGVKYAVLLVFFESLSVSLLVIPYSALVFHSLAVVGILTTVLVTPLVPVLTILSLVTALLAVFVPFGASLFAPFLAFLCQCVYAIAEACARVPLGTLSYEGGTFGVALYVASLFFVGRVMAVRQKSKEEALLFYKKSEDGEDEILRGVIRY